MSYTTKKASELRVPELKEILRSRGHNDVGTKSELIARLMEIDPVGNWMQVTPNDENQYGDGERASGPTLNMANREVGLAMTEGSSVSSDEASLRREMELYRREKELAERDLELTRRELEMLRQNMNDGEGILGRRTQTTQNLQSKVNVNAIAELLNHFDGNANIYENWGRQVKLLQTTYRLNDDVTKVLIGSRLKGRALDWFHSKPEHIELPVNDLLVRIETMFSCRKDKVAVRREFEERIWKKGETFSEYFHEKTILANRVPIAEDEMVEYVIEGIPDVALRDQARMQRFQGTASLLEAFKKITVRHKVQQPIPATSTRRDDKSWKPPRSGEKETTRGEIRCYNCGQSGHLSVACPSKNKGAKCFRCSEFGHISIKCPKNHGASKEVNTLKDTRIHTRPSRGKCLKDVRICGRDVAALIDTGSDLCLMSAEGYVKIGAPALQGVEIQFRGLGSDNNKTLGKFCEDITIDGHSYPIEIHVVPDKLLSHDLLIGADFLSTVEVNMREGRITIARIENCNSIDNRLPEIFLIDDVQEVNRIDLSYISNDEHKAKIEDIVSKYKPVKTQEVGVKMSLVLKDSIPVYQRPRRLSAIERESVNSQINEWMRDGIVRPSLSEYASPIVLVRKKNGSTRLCVDYRELNKKIVKDRYPLPLIEDQLDSLRGANVFSTLDLKNGFFHVSLCEDSRKYTAFVVPDGQYEFLKVPFGLCNSPSVFQRFINAIFRDLIAAKVVMTYMDDLILPAVDHASGLKNLETVLVVASKFGLIINWEKCRFLQESVEYLGHIVGAGGVQPSQSKTTAVMKFPQPSNVKQTQSFLGLTGYFRKFIPRYSLIARPLTNLLRANVQFEFGENQKRAFEQLKNVLCSKPILKLYNVKAETELHTDACMYGYGAILMQRDSETGSFHAVYYASGKTSSAEERYTSYELEVLAVIKALKKFRVYLLGIPFKIVTDCQAFVMTMNKKDLCVRVARWALLLEEFAYTIEHRTGSRMKHVDALSRNPLPSCLLAHEEHDSLVARLKQAQNDDSQLKKFIDFEGQNRVDGFVVKNGLLFKECDSDNVCIVVPKSMQYQIIRQVHEIGHFGVGKTESLLKRDYWFGEMRSKIEKVIRNCINCILSEKKCGKAEGFLHPIDKGEIPLDVYHIDHLGPLTSTKKSYQHIFVVIDAFSKFVWLYATKTTNATEALNKLKKQAAIFGNPRRIISDRGSAFTSHEFADYCKDENIEHVLITTGTPRSNGQVERVNRTLIPLLTKLSSPKPGEWYKHLDLAQMYLNATINRSINTSPFNLLFGVEMRLKSRPEVKEIIEQEIVKMFSENRDELRMRAKECIKKVQQENKKNFDRKRKKARVYSIGELVAIKRTQMKPGIKLAIKFFGPYRVIKTLKGDRYIVEKVGEQDGPRKTTTMAEYMKPWLINYSDDELSDNDDI